MKFSAFPFLRYTLFFVLGILIYPFFGCVSDLLLLGVIGLSFLTYLCLAIKNAIAGIFRFKFLFPFLAYIMLVLSGSFIARQQSLKNNIGLGAFSSDTTGYLGFVLDVDQPRKNSIANRIEVKAVADGGKIIPASAEVLIYHKSLVPLRPGEVIWIPGVPGVIPETGNPGAFNYRNFLVNQGITHRHFIGQNFLKLGKIWEKPVHLFFTDIRSAIMDRMKAYFSDPRALAVANALLLGQKKNLDPEVNNAYVTAGAMHVLAVSGLHVGIIYGFFFLFMKPYRLSIRLRIIYLSGIIFLVWSYAFLTGLSPSVLRAATMFSLMAMAQMKSRNPSIFNAVALSALLLLIFDPMLLYAVGFQLSYCALLGILLFQPILVRLWCPSNNTLEYIWQISTVGIAAQMATFPVSAYYFHVFPTYFILSNLIAIPGAFIVMATGVPYMLFASLPEVGNILGWCTEKSIQLVNWLIFPIQKLPMAKIENISFSPLEVGGYFIVLALLYTVVINPSKTRLRILILLLLATGIYGALNYIRQGKPELLFYVDAKGAALDYKKGKICYIWNGMPLESLDFQVNPNRLTYKHHLFLPLKAADQKGATSIYFPDDLPAMHIYRDSIRFEDGFRIKKTWQWSDSGWQTAEVKKSYQINDKAYKFELY
jgi:competence protein ComEC